MSKNIITFKLKANIDKNNRLAITVNDRGDEFQLGSVEDLIAGHPDAEAVVLELHDFEQNGASYEVFGNVIYSDGRQVAWQPIKTGAGAGIRQRFEVPKPGADRTPGFILCARSQTPGIADPTPVNRSGAGPGDVPDPHGGTNPSNN